MRSRRLRLYAWLCFVASCLMAPYCLLAIAAIASLGGAPNYPGDAHHDALQWELALIVPVALAIASVMVLVRTRQSRERSSAPDKENT
jgi:membrane protein implicated in regulation of membrane protease activity